MAQSPVSNPSANEDEGLTAYNSLHRGDATTSESSLGEEGLTTSRVNRAATDDSGHDSDVSREYQPVSVGDTNATELYPDPDGVRNDRDDVGYDSNDRESSGGDLGTGTANRPPLPNGDTGYAG